MTQHIIKDWRSAVAKLKNRVVALEKGGVGGGTPGGSDTQVQFNDSGAFGGDAGFTYNKTTDIATLTGGLTLGTSGNLFGGTNLIEQRNGTNPQTFRLYNTYTDATNYEGLELVYSGNIAYLQTVEAGTGTLRGLRLWGS